MESPSFLFLEFFQTSPFCFKLLYYVISDRIFGSFYEKILDLAFFIEKKTGKIKYIVGGTYLKKHALDLQSAPDLGISIDLKSADKELKAVTPEKSKTCVTTFTKKLVTTL